jgi:hypothetical protein
MSELFMGTISRSSRSASMALGSAAAGISTTMSELLRQFIKEGQEVKMEIALERERQYELSKKNALNILNKLDESLGLAKQVDAERLIPTDFQSCTSRIRSLKSQIYALKNAKAVDAFTSEALQAKEQIEKLIQEAQKQKDFDWIVKKTMQALSDQGFRVEVERSDTKCVSLLGQSGKKKVYLDVDHEGNLSGDFASGYNDSKDGECSKDLKQFLVGFRGNGVDVKVKSIKPVVRQKGTSNEETKKQRKSNAAS